MAWRCIFGQPFEGRHSSAGYTNRLLTTPHRPTELSWRRSSRHSTQAKTGRKQGNIQDLTKRHRSVQDLQQQLQHQAPTKTGEGNALLPNLPMSSLFNPPKQGTLRRNGEAEHWMEMHNAQRRKASATQQGDSGTFTIFNHGQQANANCRRTQKKHRSLTISAFRNGF